MQNVTLNLSFKTLPPVVKRNRHALILVRTADGKFVLGNKKHYPEGISRLVGGGIDADEDPQKAAARELTEELEIVVPAEQLQPLYKIDAFITHEGKTIKFVTWLYFYQLKLEKINPSSDLDGVAYLTEGEYLELITRFQHLSPQLHPILGFAWADYGQLYSHIHQFALDGYHALSHPQV